MFRSLKLHIGSALGIQFAVLVIVVSTTLYLLNLRKHDYLILNLSGQLRVISQLMVNYSTSYQDNAPRDYKTYYRDVRLYYQQIHALIERYDRIIDGFVARQLSPELVADNFLQANHSKPRLQSLLPAAETITCTWDKQSRNQLTVTAQHWKKFRRGLIKALGNDKENPRLEAAAEYVLFNADGLQQSATSLTVAFRNMMEQKLQQITWLNRLSIIVSLLISMTVFLVIYRKVFTPIEQTVQAFDRVAQGELNLQVEESETRELGQLTKSFKHLTARLKALFALTDRIYQATSLDEIIQFVYEEFKGFLPLDWVAMLQMDVSKNKLVICHRYPGKDARLHEGDTVSVSHPFIRKMLDSGQVLSLDALDSAIRNIAEEDAFFSALAAMGMKSVIIFPVSLTADESSVLIFATDKAAAYQQSHRELLKNISAQVRNAFDRSVGMETLVISAVEGLAKLAESRDPETGDHLQRMSLYSWAIAKAMCNNGNNPYQISASFPRHVYQFAPMHDIGKVGIEDDILLKPGKLNEQEWLEMKKHPVIGADVLRRCEQQVSQAGFSFFTIGIEIAEGHHEKFDGSGYPYQRKGEEIPLSARIVALADVFDALTSRRPYKEAWPVEKALALIDEESGHHFDPQVVAAFKSVLPEIMDIYHQHKHV